MLVKMTTSVATSYGAYNAGHEYDLSPQLVAEFSRHGWCDIVEESQPVEAAVLPAVEHETQHNPRGRGRPITARKQ